MLPDAYSVYIGMVLVLAAVLFIAIGANVQRYALRYVDPKLRLCGCLSRRSLTWFGGLSIYFFANVLYTFGLVYAPATLCATLFAASERNMPEHTHTHTLSTHTHALCA